MSRRDLLATALCLGLSGAATGETPPRKPPTQVVLDYRRQAGAEGCPSKPELESEVRDILGRSPFARKAPRTVRCVLRADDGGLAARVQLVDGRSGRVLGVRELSAAGPGCEELGGAVALAIALAIDPLARPPRPPAAPTVTATPPKPPPAAAAAPTSPSSGLSGTAASAAGAGAAGVSGAPRTGPPTRGPPGARRRAALPGGLVPLALAQAPDAAS
jgi:hypothetical protein